MARRVGEKAHAPESQIVLSSPKKQLEPTFPGISIRGILQHSPKPFGRTVLEGSKCFMNPARLCGFRK
jgi:hypothetical protein